MTEREAIKEIRAMRGWTMAELAQESGYKSWNNINQMLNHNTVGMRMDGVYRLVSAMGCEVVIRDKMGSKREWVIDMR